MAGDLKGLGDVKINATYSNKQIPLRAVTITENFNTLGPVMDANLIDLYGQFGKIEGKETDKIEVSLEDPYGRKNAFNFVPFEHANLNDAAEEVGSGRQQISQLRCVSPEFRTAQKKPVNKSYNNKSTTDISSDILKNFYQTDKEIKVLDESKAKKNMTFQNDNPVGAITEKLEREHISTVGKSSAYVTYQQQQNGKTDYIITTFDERMKQKPIAKYSRRNDAFSRQDASNMFTLLEFNISSGFNKLREPDEFNGETSYNASTGQVFINPGKAKDGKPIGKKQIRTQYDKVNSPSPHSTAEARTSRAKMYSKLSNTRAIAKIYGNPNLYLGCVVDIDPGTNPGPVNGKCLVTSIQHHIAGEGVKPRYTQTLELVPIIES